MPRLYFQTVPEPKRVKNRVHLDVSPDSDAKQAELARLVGLGATVAAGQLGGGASCTAPRRASCE